MRTLFALVCLFSWSVSAAAGVVGPDTPEDPEDEAFADEPDESAAALANDPFEGFNRGELKTPSEDVGQAFGRWGIAPGPYLVLPLLGPSSVRDFAGSFGDAMLSPAQRWLASGLGWEQRTAYTVANTFHNLPERLRMFDELQRMSVDPYVAMRDGYLQYREAEVKQ